MNLCLHPASYKPLFSGVLALDKCFSATAYDGASGYSIYGILKICPYALIYTKGDP